MINGPDEAELIFNRERVFFFDEVGLFSQQSIKTFTYLVIHGFECRFDRSCDTTLCSHNKLRWIRQDWLKCLLLN